MTPLLDVADLSIGFGIEPPVVQGVSFSVMPGETLALVGESGSGKTLTCRSVLRILPGAAQLRSGSIRFGRAGAVQDLLTLPTRKMRDIRGNHISMIFQEPMRSLSPLHRIGNQVSEVLKLHRSKTGTNPRKQVLETFEQVGFTDPERVWRAYPFELSGGMRQRAMIAMAMVARPDLLIADEPTTALDVTTQAQVLGLIKQLQRDTGMAVILVTHDLGVVANMAEKVVVMNKGMVMESGPAAAVLGAPQHGYTQKLFAAAPMIPQVAAPSAPVVYDDLILDMQHVSKTYQMRASGWKAPIQVRACIDVNLSLPRGRTLAVVGESGSGKTTCARIALGAEMPDNGSQVLFRAKGADAALPVHAMDRAQRTRFQRSAQMVFQDPYSSLSPRMRIQEALTEPMEIHGLGTRADPELLVCDEPTSALDVSVQEQILTLLEDIQERMGLSYLFISHDLAVVSRIADEVAVMRQGVIVEQAPPDTLFYSPQHPYTKALIAAQPEPDLSRPIDLALVAKGAGSPASWPEMFRFDGSAAPALVEVNPGHQVRCHV